MWTIPLLPLLVKEHLLHSPAPSTSTIFEPTLQPLHFPETALPTLQPQRVTHLTLPPNPSATRGPWSLGRRSRPTGIPRGPVDGPTSDGTQRVDEARFFG